MLWNGWKLQKLCKYIENQRSNCYLSPILQAWCLILFLMIIREIYFAQITFRYPRQCKHILWVEFMANSILPVKIKKPQEIWWSDIERLLLKGENLKRKIQSCEVFYFRLRNEKRNWFKPSRPVVFHSTELVCGSSCFSLLLHWFSAVNQK